MKKTVVTIPPFVTKPPSTYTIKKAMHFLDITPLNQLELLNHAMSMDEPLLIRYSMTVLLAFRRRVRTSVFPFKEGDMEIEEYYTHSGAV